MNVNYAIWDEEDWFKDDDELYDKYINILNSDLSILKIWMSILGENMIIKPRANNIFYSKCCFHRANDIPVCINEKLKGFLCYGCGVGGTIVTLISEHFNINMEDTVTILYAYINNNLNSLTKHQLEIFKSIFENYNLPIVDKYFDESKKKTDLLNNRIDNYSSKFGTSSDNVKKMAKRLCCSRYYVEGRIKNK